MIEFKIDMKKIWRYHSDKGTEFLGACDEWLKELLIHASTTAGYESQSNSIAENLIGELEKEVFGRCCIRATLRSRCGWKPLSTSIRSLSEQRTKPRPRGGD